MERRLQSGSFHVVNGLSGGRGAASAPPQLPSVCVVMPTNSRPEFVEHALGRVAAQDYPASQLRQVVVVDDSPAPLRVPSLRPGQQRWHPANAPTGAPLAKRVATRTGATAAGAALQAGSDGLQVEYVLLPRQVSIGQKRNLAAARCGTAEVVVHWDDDDFYGPSRLRAQARRRTPHRHSP